MDNNRNYTVLVSRKNWPYAYKIAPETMLMQSISEFEYFGLPSDEDATTVPMIELICSVNLLVAIGFYLDEALEDEGWLDGEGRVNSDTIVRLYPRTTPNGYHQLTISFDTWEQLAKEFSFPTAPQWIINAEVIKAINRSNTSGIAIRLIDYL